MSTTLTPQQQMKELRKQMFALEREIQAEEEKARRVPEPKGAHPIVKFTIREQGKVDFLAAIKEKGRWSVTGSDTRYTWAELRDMVDRAGSRIVVITGGTEE